ncbi:helix-turn-helix transcriptional regulator [Actinophytocola oryzae]|uniref:Putative DNA-binding transcriptional regulator YafY n=1 Tax=Actinophytocola oryzae TaxID=502181 RepID=A0A4R7W146_9PSEU|nr:YafY family protein [Actinophytocola oryzae]TDV56256.1 putative DNA-binding transcriptional regulator YafY [Actinophytocola oryzae]
MPRPAARVLALLEILQSGGTRTTADLAAQLGVDQRTVRRYVAHLVDLDVPVESVRGPHGGYRLMPGYRMPPLMLTDEEALAVLLGLVAGHRAGLVTTSAAAAESAVAKLRRVLPKPLAARLGALLETTDFTAPARPATTPETEVLLRLADAARGRRPVEIGYTGRDARRGERTVHPYGIVAHSGRWYLTGADSVSGEVRTFRLDRIGHVAPRDGTFEVPTGFDPAAHVLAGIAGTPWRHQVSVRVLGDLDTVRSRLPRGIASLEPVDVSWVRVRIEAERLDWIPGVLTALDAPFVIESPDELRETVRALATRLLDGVGSARLPVTGVRDGEQGEDRQARGDHEQ